MSKNDKSYRPSSSTERKDSNKEWDQDQLGVFISTIQSNIGKIDAFITQNELSKASQLIKQSLQLCRNPLYKGKYLESEYELFKKLTSIYIKNANAHSHDYTKIVSICQYLYKLIEKLPDNINKEEKRQEITTIKLSAEKQFIENVTRKELTNDFRIRDAQRAKEHKRVLEEYRKELRNKLKTIENLGIGQKLVIQKETDQKSVELNEKELRVRANIVKNIYTDIKQQLVGQNGLIVRLIDECKQELGASPCTYSILGLGSIALGTMTPWSDLEWAILIEDGLDAKKQKLAKDYFRNFASLLHAKIINFGETPLRMMGIKELNDFRSEDIEDNWFYDDLTKSGFSIDGPHWHACKSPIGRKAYKGYKDFELISTPQELTNFQEDEWYRHDHHLQQALLFPVLIEGDEQLFNDYLQRVQIRLKSEQSSGVTLFQERSFKLLQENVELFKPYAFSLEKEGTLLNVKKEIYRLPDRFMAGLASCLGIFGRSNFELIDILTQREHITEVSAEHLRVVLGIATELRLRTYSSNNSQQDDIPLLQNVEKQLQADPTKNLEKIFHFKDNIIIFRFYHTLIPLIMLIQGTNSPLEMTENLKTCSFNANSRFWSYLIDGLVHFRLLDYRSTKTNLEICQAMLEGKENSHINKEKALNTILPVLAYVCDQLNFTQEALKYSKLALENTRKAYGESSIQYALSLNNAGMAYMKNRELSQAEKHYKLSLKIKEELKKKDIQYARTLNNLANVYAAQGNNEEAVKLYKQSSAIKEEIPHESSPLVNVATLNNLGAVYIKLSQYNKAKEIFIDALAIIEKSAGKGHPSYGLIVHNLGIIEHELKDFEQSLTWHQLALKIAKQAYGVTHKNYVEGLYRIAETYRSMRKFKEALENSKEHLIGVEFLLGKFHPDYTRAIKQLTNIHLSMGNEKEAQRMYEEAMAIERQKASGKGVQTSGSNRIEQVIIDSDKDSKILSLDEAIQMAKDYERQGHNEAAIRCYHNALTVYEVTENKDPMIMIVFKNLSALYYNIGQYREAISYGEKCLTEIGKTIGVKHRGYGGQLNDLAAMYHAWGDHKTAIRYWQRCLSTDSIKKDPDLRGTILNNIANNYSAQGKYDEAIKHWQEACKIFKDSNKKHYISSIENIIKSYYAKGDCDGVIEYQQKLIELTPQNRDLRHNLAYFHFINAINYSQKGNKDAYNEQMRLAKSIFTSTMDMQLQEPVSSAQYVEYAMFLMENHNKNSNDEYKEILEYLQKAINLRNDGSELRYASLEKPTLPVPLKQILASSKEIVVNPEALARYLLVKVNYQHDKKEDVIKNLKDFQNSIKGQDQESISFHLLKQGHKESGFDFQVKDNTNWNKIGVDHFRGGRYKEATDAFSEAINPSSFPSFELFYNRGRAYQENGELDKAIKDYKTVIKTNSTHSKSYHRLGICYQKKGENLQARAYLMQAIEYDPKLELAQKALQELSVSESASQTANIQQPTSIGEHAQRYLSENSNNARKDYSASSSAPTPTEDIGERKPFSNGMAIIMTTNFKRILISKKINTSITYEWNSIIKDIQEILISVIGNTSVTFTKEGQDELTNKLVGVVSAKQKNIISKDDIKNFAAEFRSVIATFCHIVLSEQSNISVMSK